MTEQLLRLQKEQTVPNLIPSEIESLIILDRACDLITPLRSQLTYEGVIDEMFGIDAGM
jgi:vacuolar protein sorting-associated protein 33A